MSSSIDNPAGVDAPYWEGHRSRLRRRLEREGWDALKPHEMVELVLYHAAPRQDLTGIARALVDRFGSVGGVFAAPREQLCEVPGMTPSMTEWVALTGEAMRAYCATADDDSVRLSRWPEVREFLAPIAPDADAAWVLLIDFEFSLITCLALESAPWWDSENARQMVRQAVAAGARYAIIALFGRDAPPAMPDEALARLQAIAVTMRAIDVDILDCVLVGGGGMTSLNRSGRMDAVRAESHDLALHERYADGD